MTFPLEKTLISEKNGKEFYNIKIAKEDWLLFEKQFIEYYKEREKIKRDMIEAIKDAKDILDGKRKAKTLREAIDELD